MNIQNNLLSKLGEARNLRNQDTLVGRGSRSKCLNKNLKIRVKRISKEIEYFLETVKYFLDL